MLQDGLIPYSASDIESMAETRFKDNPTMLQVLRGYVDKHNLLSQLKNNSVLLYSSKAKKLAAADALSEELIGIIGSAKEDIGHLTAVQLSLIHIFFLMHALQSKERRSNYKDRRKISKNSWSRHH